MKPLFRILIRQTTMDFRRRHLGTMLGGLWALISPLVTISLIFFVFSFGLKTGFMGDISFINWLVPAMLIWSFMSESIVTGCTAITENNHLVTKVVFPVQILPPAKVFSTAPVHLCLMSIFLIILYFEGSGSISTWWQIFYYFGCATFFCVSLTYITSACMVFIRDTSNVVGVIIQIFFWATPIFWDPAMIRGTRLQFLLLSPFNYIVQGYRDSLYSGIYFWNRPKEMLFFWFTLFFVSAVAWLFFNRTRPHFADVL